MTREELEDLACYCTTGEARLLLALIEVAVRDQDEKWLSGDICRRLCRYIRQSAGAEPVPRDR